MLAAQEESKRQADGKGSARDEGGIRTTDNKSRFARPTSFGQEELQPGSLSKKAVSWQSSVRETCEMPIYSLANIASDRTTTADPSLFKLQLQLQL